MELKPGAKLGAYEILTLLGRGGMGEVWRARDPQLGRDVAIKVSAQQFTDRFEREARAIASLNHPNVCTLYHIGPNYLVMELIEGPTLAERIREGAIPLDEALGYARQIAAGLEAAHEKGITHRDLKPANVKIRPDGSVKVLDFGLAKRAEEAEYGPDSPTMMPGTQMGMIMGTAGYMAPEQARGKIDVDKRADIWAFAVVLHEMLTGKRLFQGEDVTDTLASIIKEQPSLNDAPPQLLPLLKRCLEKDPRKRLRDIGDWELLLVSEPSATAPSRSRLGKVGKTGWIAAGVMTLVAAALGVVAWGYYSAEPQVMRATLQMPETANLAPYSALPTISPDGRYVVVAAVVSGKRGLWLRDLDELSARLLPDTGGAYLPFWSPDSRWIAFLSSDQKVKKISVSGGPVLTICAFEPGQYLGGSWNREGSILFGSVPGLSLVPAAGGTPTLLTAPDAAAGEVALRAPWFLPDGRHFLYTARNQDTQKTRVYVDSIDARPGSKTRREVLAGATNAIFVPRARASLLGSSEGYLLYARENTLMAQPFDASALRTTGDAMPVAEGVDFVSIYAQSQFSASQNGALVYTSGASVTGNVQLTWFDRTGKPGGTVGNPGVILVASVSPDGDTVAEDLRDASGLRDIWLEDLKRNTSSRFTFGPGNEFPVWSPDGNSVAYFSQRNGHDGPWRKAASGVGQEEEIQKDPPGIFVTDWSRDGRYLIEQVTGQTGQDIWVNPLFGDKKPFPYIDTAFIDMAGKLSPDGRFLAYLSNESKRPEIYVQTFPEHAGKWQVSTGGVGQGSPTPGPVWSRDGRELYFLSGDNKMMAVEIKAGNGTKFEAGVPRTLFEVRQGGQFDVGKDGRFLIHVPVDKAPASVPLTLVVNWQSALKK